MFASESTLFQQCNSEPDLKVLKRYTKRELILSDNVLQYWAEKLSKPGYLYIFRDFIAKVTSKSIKSAFTETANDTGRLEKARLLLLLINLSK